MWTLVWLGRRHEDCVCTQGYWVVPYPADTIKSRIQTDPNMTGKSFVQVGRLVTWACWWWQSDVHAQVARHVVDTEGWQDMCLQRVIALNVHLTPYFTLPRCDQGWSGCTGAAPSPACARCRRARWCTTCTTGATGGSLHFSTYAYHSVLLHLHTSLLTFLYMNIRTQ